MVSTFATIQDAFWRWWLDINSKYIGAFMQNQDSLRKLLQDDPRVKERLDNARDRETAQAAISFFVDRVCPINDASFQTITWGRVLMAFKELAKVDEAIWIEVDNRNAGSLKTYASRLQIGDVIEIADGDWRFATSVMGSDGNWHATFKGQGSIPIGPIKWRMVATAERSSLISVEYEALTQASIPAVPQPPIVEPRPHHPISWERLLAIIAGIAAAITAVATAVATLMKSK